MRNIDLSKQEYTLDGAEDSRTQRRRWLWLLSKCQDVDLSDREERFVNDLIRKSDKQGDNFFLTEAQDEWLEAIARRVD